MSALPSGAVTFVFTDIEGSTRLVKALREGYPRVLAEHRRLVRAAIAAQGGHEVDTQGDAFFVAFAGAKQAVLCALQIQRALAGHDWPEGAPVRVRIGIHTGHAAPAEGVYAGLAVHRAARICAAAAGGQVLVSQATQTIIEDEEEEPGFMLSDVGERTLKDLDRPVRLFQLAAPGLDTRAPPAGQPAGGPARDIPAAPGGAEPGAFAAVATRALPRDTALTAARHAGDRLSEADMLGERGVALGILERDAELSVLADAVQAAAGGHGSVVLIFGEAGIGKSSLVEAVRAQLPAEGRMFVGYCDDLTTPRALGPFRDLVRSVGAELSAAVMDGGDRDRLLSALRAELDWPEHPAVLVIEDIHWADDATLDVLRYLIRRIAALPAALVLTYRDDELGREHALHGLLGQVSRSEQVRRLPLRRLSADAVRRLSASSPVNAGDLFALTSGNPFFVHELLASAHGDQVPPSIADAVLARVRSLDPATQDLLEQLAVVPAAIDRWLVDALVPGIVLDATAVLAAAEQHSLLTVSARKISFRHELTRRAIAGAVPTARLMALNQRVLDVLVKRDGTDVSQIVHHAAQAGDADAIVRYGPAAAREAIRAGAHREAVAHLGLVLEHSGRFTVGERAELLQQYAIECHTLGAAQRAVEAQQKAVGLNRSLSDLAALGASLRWLSRMQWWRGDRASAEQAGREAVSVLEQAGDASLLALALSNQSQLCMLADRPVESIAYGERAAALARQVGDAATTSHALTNIGSSQWILGDPAGQPTIQEALRIALEAGNVEDACRAYANIVWILLDWFRLDEADHYLTAGIKLAEESEFLGWLSYMNLERARLAFSLGEWDQAVRLAEPGVDAPAPIRCTALTVLGRIRTRRGQPGAASMLETAWELAVRAGELQRMSPVAAARAEDAWLSGDHACVRDVAAPVYEVARNVGDQVYQAELGYWLVKAGRSAETGSDHPYALQAAGRWQEAAAAWQAAGCPYEHAAALAESPDPQHLLAALGILDGLGARPLATQVRMRLRTLGLTHIPRGPVGETRANPAGLTARQIDVLRLLAKGNTNAEIARKLAVSVRTVDSHVAAVLGKLGARDRRHAATRAAELGVLDADDR
jgi:class 3 adenylate cyclase/DNA-binding CsgD family transcriptional regulator/tetratricopeptide (TPR) repeat protein